MLNIYAKSDLNSLEECHNSDDFKNIYFHLFNEAININNSKEDLDSMLMNCAKTLEINILISINFQEFRAFLSLNSKTNLYLLKTDAYYIMYPDTNYYFIAMQLFCSGKVVDVSKPSFVTNPKFSPAPLNNFSNNTRLPETYNYRENAKYGPINLNNPIELNSRNFKNDQGSIRENIFNNKRKAVQPNIPPPKGDLTRIGSQYQIEPKKFADPYDKNQLYTNKLPLNNAPNPTTETYKFSKNTFSPYKTSKDIPEQSEKKYFNDNNSKMPYENHQVYETKLPQKTSSFIPKQSSQFENNNIKNKILDIEIQPKKNDSNANNSSIIVADQYNSQINEAKLPTPSKPGCNKCKTPGFTLELDCSCKICSLCLEDQFFQEQKFFCPSCNCKINNEMRINILQYMKWRHMDEVKVYKEKRK